MSSSTPSNNPQTSGSKGPLRSSPPDTLINLLAGGMGGTAGAILTCPLEVVKTRLQSSNSGFIPPSQSKTTSKTTSTAASKVASSNPSGGDGGTGGKNSSSQTVKSKAVFPNQRPLGGITANLALDMGKETRTGSTTVPHAIPARGESLRQAHHRHGGVVRGQMQLQQSQIRPQISSNAGINYGSVLVRCSSSAVPAAVNPSPVPPPGQQMGVLECLRFIIRHEGVMGLFKGLGPNLVGVFPSRAIYFWAYSTAKRNVNSSMPKRNRDTPFVHVVSAGMAGFTASSATNPIWLIKTRLQLDRASGAKTLTVTNCMRKIYSELGFFGFWKGVTASYWGISETVIHFVLYEFFKKQLAIYNQRPKDAKEKTFKEFVGYMLCGACSKTCATIVAYPHEVARTRLREEGNKYRSFWQTIFKVGREEGRRGLYRGLATQLVRQIPNTAVMMSVYELTVYTLTRYYHQNYATVETNSTMIDNGSSLNRGGASTPDKGDTIEPSIGQKSSHGQ